RRVGIGAGGDEVITADIDIGGLDHAPQAGQGQLVGRTADLREASVVAEDDVVAIAGVDDVGEGDVEGLQADHARGADVRQLGDAIEVEAAVAEDEVVAAAAAEDVGAGAAGDPVSRGGAEDDVIAGAAVEDARGAGGGSVDQVVARGAVVRQAGV